ncbi:MULTISPECIES: hypothetical protein [Olivibacter]|uniref:Uncharacterized protein n=1 Tax=Olivibacter jilunii TaxID=985016 RepID=A0ABW6AZZ0_9SPHI
MKTYYFTFRFGHLSKSNIPMRKYWVRVIAQDYNIARELFIERFTKVYMPRPDQFAFQYEESKFNKDYYPNGEFAVIQQEKILKYERGYKYGKRNYR